MARRDGPQNPLAEAQAALQRGALAAAVAAYDRALAASTPPVTAWLGRAFALERLGRRDEAVESYRGALGLEPHSALAWAGLANLGALDADPQGRARMAAVVAAVAPASDDALSLHFALAGAYHRAGASDRAMAHYHTGNAIAAGRFAYDVAAEADALAAIARTVDAAALARLAGGGAPSDRPIFILGMPRSGTTLVEQILASHSDVAAGGEREALPRLLAGAGTPGGKVQGYPDLVPHLGPAEAGELGRAYLAGLPEAPAGEARLTDKLPANFRYLGLIRAILPDAAIIHVSREPADTALACYRQNFAQGHRFSYDLYSAGRYTRAYCQLMDHWRAVLPAEAYLTVAYEDLIVDPDREIARLLDYCGLPRQEACWRFPAQQRDVQTASRNQVGQALHTRSAGAWRRYRAHLGPLFQGLGDLAPGQG